MAKSMRARLIIAMSIILVAAFLSISILNYQTTKSALHEEIVSSSLPLLRENIYSELQKDFVPSLHRASLMANDSFLKNWAADGEEDPREVIQYLREILDKYDYFSTFFVSETSGNYYYYDGILKQISRDDDHDVWYYRFVGSGREYVLDVDTNEAAENRLTIFVNYRVEGADGQILGVTGVGIQMQNFSNYLSERQEKYDREIYLVDQNGIIQAHTDLSKIHGPPLDEQPGIGAIAEQILEGNASTVNESYRRDGSTILVTSRYMPELEWFLIVEHDEGASLVTLRRSLVRTILLGLLASAVVIALSIVVINYYQRRLEQLTVTDELTKTANRRGFERYLQRSLSRNARHGTAGSLMIVDVDNFKEINDDQGHLVGDRVLKNVAERISSNVRSEDVVARWGGDEFAVLLEATDEDEGTTAERIRRLVEELGVSVSIGISRMAKDDTADSLLQRADAALYSAKSGGRNRVVVA